MSEDRLEPTVKPVSDDASPRHAWVGSAKSEMIYLSERVDKLLLAEEANETLITLEYPFEITRLSDAEGSGYQLRFPDLPGCISDGVTFEEATAHGADALKGWLETRGEQGLPIPAPNSSRGLAHRGSLAGTVLRFDDPFEPVSSQDWDAVQEKPD